MVVKTNLPQVIRKVKIFGRGLNVKLPSNIPSLACQCIKSLAFPTIDPRFDAPNLTS